MTVTVFSTEQLDPTDPPEVNTPPAGSSKVTMSFVMALMAVATAGAVWMA